MQSWSKTDIERTLTPRQLEVLTLVARRFTSKEIGRDLQLSPKTVDRHVEEITARLGVSSRSEAGRLLLEACDQAGEEFPMVTAKLAPNAPDRPEMGQPESDLLDGLTGSQAPSERTFWAIIKHHIALPPVGGARHDLTVVQRLGVIGRVALASIIVIAATVTLISGIFYHLNPQ